MARTEQELLQAVLDARTEVDRIDDLLSAAKQVKEKAVTELVEYMDNRDLKSFKSATLGITAIRKETLYVSIDKEKHEEAMRWIQEDMGRGDMIKATIHNKTLSSFISDMLKKGEQIPQDLFKWFFKPEISIINAKKEA
jgi:molybdenum cofactor biosynthesis enzyme MoaA